MKKLTKSTPHTRSHLGRIRSVISEFDPAKLLVAEGDFKPFETKFEAAHHDRIRDHENDRALKRVTCPKARTLYRRYKRALLKGARSNSPAVFSAARKIRRRLVSHLASLAANLPYPFWQVTIMADEWEIDASLLTPALMRATVGKMRKLLFRNHWQKLAGGIVLFLDVEFEVVTKRYRLHFHGIAFGDQMRHALNKLNRLSRFQRIREGAAVQLSELNNPVRQIAYAIKPYCNGRIIRRDGIEAKSPRYVPRNEKRRFNSILNALTYADLTILKNVRIYDGSFVYSKPT